MNFYFNTVEYKSPSLIVILKKYIKYIIKFLFKYDITLERRLLNSSNLLENKEILKNHVFNNTMLSNDKLLNLKISLEYIINNKINGDIVECGVWKGGAMAFGAKILLNNNCLKKIYLFDLFDNCPQPDFRYDGERAIKEIGIKESQGLLKPITNTYDNIVHNGPGDEENVNDLLVNKIGYPSDKLILVKGYFQETLLIAKNLPEKISLLRLDGDWYASTKVCLENLYPLVEKGGVVIIDDYFGFEGCKKAVDEFLINQKYKPLINSFNNKLIYWIKN